MTTTNDTESFYLDLHNDDQWKKEIFLTLDDNGDWEYTRLGFGEDHHGLYLVDLDDTGESLRDKLHIDPRFTVDDVLAEGVALGLFEKYEEGDSRGTHGVRIDNLNGAWDGLLAHILA